MAFSPMSMARRLVGSRMGGQAPIVPQPPQGGMMGRQGIGGMMRAVPNMMSRWGAQPQLQPQPQPQPGMMAQPVPPPQPGGWLQAASNPNPAYAQPDPRGLAQQQAMANFLRQRQQVPAAGLQNRMMP